MQAAAKILIEPIFEADFQPCSFGFRPKRSAHDALQVLIDESWRGKRWVVETDIASCFVEIPHDPQGGVISFVAKRRAGFAGGRRLFTVTPEPAAYWIAALAHRYWWTHYGVPLTPPRPRRDQSPLRRAEFRPRHPGARPAEDDVGLAVLGAPRVGPQWGTAHMSLHCQFTVLDHSSPMSTNHQRSSR